METKKRFYRIHNAQDQSRGFAWAMGFGPLPGGMPFLLPVELESSLAYWRINPSPPGILVEEHDGVSVAKRWPDFMGHGGGSPDHFVSRKVLDSIAAAGIPIARVTPMPIGKVESKFLSVSEAPDYFVIEAPYGIDTDYQASGVPTDANGKPIFPLPKSVIWKLSLPSWNGLDLFASPNIWKQPSCSLICTEKVVELAKREAWTNCRFEPIWAV